MKMSKNVKVIYEDSAITVEEHKLGMHKSLIYMYDRSGQREFCCNAEQFKGVVSSYIKKERKR